MNQDKLVSVVVATYNTSQFISEALDSVLEQQDYANLEIIVVDDGSTDETSLVIKRYLKDTRIKYILQEHGGQAKAKNKGIKEAKGYYIAFLDADDKWTRDKLKKQIPCFNISSKIGVVYPNFSLLSEDGKILGPVEREYYSGNITGKLLINNFVTGMASIVKKECFDKVGVFDESLPMGIDYDLWLRISAYYEFYFLDEITYLYRQWPGQMSHNHRGRYENAIKIMKNFLNNHPALVDNKTINEAWAHTYVGKGDVIFSKEKLKKEAFLNYMTALKYKKIYIPAWKSLVKLLINRYTA